MIGALFKALGWFGSFIFATGLIKVASLVTFYVVTVAVGEYFISLIFSSLSGYSAIALLELAGVGESISIIGGAVLLRFVIANVSMVPGASILGGS